MCDDNGQLLFYTNGVKVWNQQHDQMPNGFDLMGNNSSTMSGIIVPKPGSNTVYYIFTVDQLGLPNGLRYSEVDLSLEGGLGDVTALKNVPIITPVCEKVVAIPHQNNVDFWIITRGDGTDFHAFLLSSAGLDMTAVVSSVGVNLPTPLGGTALGSLVGSHDGSQIACTNEGLILTCEILDFDRSTGLLSNPIHIVTAPRRGYGIEFSPDDNTLYMSTLEGSDGQLMQYDLTSGIEAEIVNSGTLIASVPYFLGALQLAPDGLIYAANFGQQNLGAINEPNQLGIGCNFVPDQFALQSNSNFGLPANLDVVTIQSEYRCFGDSTEFTFSSNGYSIDSVHWDFDDLATGALNFSSEHSPHHVFSSVGSYTITLTLYYNQGSIVVERAVHILPEPVVDLGPDTTICIGVAIILETIEEIETNYLWQDSTTGNTLSVSVDGEYWVTAENGCASVSDTIQLTVLPELHLGSDTTLCYYDSLLVVPPESLAPFTWNDGSTENSFTIQSEGSYWVSIDNQCGAFSDTINVQFIDALSLSLGPDTALCIGQTIVLEVNEYPSTTYLWQDGSTDTTLEVSSIGEYWISIENGCEALSDTIQVTVLPELNLGNDTTLCFFQDLVLSPPTELAPFTWNDGSISHSYFIDDEGSYWATVDNHCGQFSDTIYVEVIDSIGVQLGSDTTLCEGDTLRLDAGVFDATYSWQDGSAQTSYIVTESGEYTVSIENECIVASDAIEIQYSEIPMFLLGEDIDTCGGYEVTLSIPVDGGSYLWSLGSAEQEIIIEQQTDSIWAKVSLNGCSHTDSIWVEFRECNSVLVYPTAFSPTGDNINERFIPIRTEHLDNGDLTIMNRWGNVVYESSDMILGWGGEGPRNQLLEAGVYYWIASFEDRFGLFKKESGYVHLMR